MKRILLAAVVGLGVTAATAADARADTACGGSFNFGIDIGFKWGFNCWNKCCCPPGGLAPAAPAMYNAYPGPFPGYGYAPAFGYGGYPGYVAAGNGYDQGAALAGYNNGPTNNGAANTNANGYGGTMPATYGGYGGYGY
jgi:hypothetical protein